MRYILIILLQIVYLSQGALHAATVTMTDPTQEFSLGSSATTDGFGTRLAYGNFNNDAYEDMIALSPHTTTSAGKVGALTVFHGKAAGFSTSPTTTITGPDALNDATQAAFNTLVVADFNKDNYDDVAIGIPFWNKNSGEYDGRVVLYFGSSTGLKAAGHLIIPAPLAKGRFGTKVKAGDINGDGYDDLVVTSPNSNSPGAGTGHVHVFKGGAAMDATHDREWSDATSAQGYKFGNTILVSDVTGDGKADVFIANKLFKAEIFYYKGAATIPTNPTSIKPEANEDATLVEFSGDLNQDGYNDVILQEQIPSQFAVYKGSSTFSFGTRVDREFSPRHTELAIVTDIKDVNNDSYPDLITRFYTVNKTNYQVRIYPGNATNYVTTTPIFHMNDNDTSQGAQVSGAVAINSDNSTLPKIYASTKKSPDIYYVYEYDLNNTPPVVSSPIPDITKDEDSPLFLHSDLNTIFSDPDSHPLSFAIQSNSNTAMVTVAIDANKKLQITPQPNKSGIATIIVKATDAPFGTVVRDTFTITINEINDAPTVISAIPNRTKAEDFGTFTHTDLDNVFNDIESSMTFTIKSQTNPDLATVSINTYNQLKFVKKANQFGVDTIEVEAKDVDGLWVTDTMIFTVTAVNDAPVISAVTNQEIVEDNPVTLDLSMVTATDVEGDPLTLQIGSGNNYTVTGLTVKPDSNFTGALTVPLTVNDGELSSAVKNMTITVTGVNDAPVQLQDFTFWGFGEDVGAFPTFKLSDYFTDPEEGTAITYSIDSLSDSSKITATMNSENQVVVAPKKDQFGNCWVYVRATDSEGLFVTSKFEIRIGNSPDKPVITSAATVAATEDILCTYIGTATDVDGDVLTISYGSVPSWMSVSGDTITGTPHESVGDTSFTLYVTDGTFTESLTVVITVTPVNDAPVLTTVNGQTILEDSSLEITLAMTNATDAEGDPLSLLIGTGDNYTVSGTTVTPTALFNGTLTVPVTVTDGLLNSATVPMTVTVTAVNNAPTLTTVTAQTIAEDTPLEITLAMTNAVDPDGTTPSLLIGTGDNYTVTGTTITPAANFNGTLSVPVQATDGLETTATVVMSVTVTAVNDAPVLTAVTAQTIAEDTPLEITLAMTNATDVESTPTLIIGAGDNYTVSGTTITPTANFNGSLSVPVQATDGLETSGPVSMIVSVTAVNDAPVLSMVNAQTVLEGTALTVTLAMTDAADVDGDVLSIVLGSGDNYTVADAVVTPSALFNGTLTVPVTITDGLLNSATVAMTVTVTNVNNAPTLTTVTAQTIAEDTPLEITLAMTNAADPDGTTPSLIIGSGDNYTVTGTTVTPVANFNGLLLVPVQATDGLETTAPVVMSVTVTPVNDAPTLSTVTVPAVEKGMDVTVTLTMTDAADIDGDVLSLVLGAGENYTLSGATIIPSADFIGELQVPVTVTDGLLNSATVTATVSVIPGTAILEKDIEIATPVVTLLVAPNPVSAEDESVQFIIPEDMDGELSITIYDVLGNMIDQSQDLSGEGVVYEWDLTNRFGTPVASGTYVAICTWRTANGESMMKRLIGVRR